MNQMTTVNDKVFKHQLKTLPLKNRFAPYLSLVKVKPIKGR